MKCAFSTSEFEVWPCVYTRNEYERSICQATLNIVLAKIKTPKFVLSFFRNSGKIAFDEEIKKIVDRERQS